MRGRSGAVPPLGKPLMVSIGEGITRARAALDKVDELRTELPQAAAMAAAKTCADIVRKHGGTRENYMDLMTAAWDAK